MPYDQDMEALLKHRIEQENRMTTLENQVGTLESITEELKQSVVKVSDASKDAYSKIFITVICAVVANALGVLYVIIKGAH